LAEHTRVITSEVREDSAGPVFSISGAADDPLRPQICEHLANLLDSNGRWQEATNVRNSAKWGPQLFGDMQTASQSFGAEAQVPVGPDAQGPVDPKEQSIGG
jgi:hypothetical protein